MAQPQTIAVGYHVISSTKPPQFMGEFSKADVPEGSSIRDLFCPIKGQDDPRLENYTDPQQVAFWIFKTPVKFPSFKNDQMKLARNLRLSEDEISPDETDAGEDVRICQELDLVFEIRSGEVEWSDEKLCILF
jgi:hypothetical protein